MSKFTIKHIHQDPPKEWKGPNGVVWYRTVDLFEHDKPVSIGKKTPDALKNDMEIFGDIIETDFIEDKFKASPPPAQTSFTGNDERGDAITASMVVKIAFQAFMSTEGMLPQEDAHWRQIDYMAEMLKTSIEKIKAGKVDLENIKEVFKEPLPLPPEDLGEIDDSSP